MDTATRLCDDQHDSTDRMSVEFEIVREQLSAIEAALPDYGPSFSALEQQKQIAKSDARVEAILARAKG